MSLFLKLIPINQTFQAVDYKFSIICFSLILTSKIVNFLTHLLANSDPLSERTASGFLLSFKISTHSEHPGMFFLLMGEPTDILKTDQ